MPMNAVIATRVPFPTSGHIAGRFGASKAMIAAVKRTQATRLTNSRRRRIVRRADDEDEGRRQDEDESDSLKGLGIIVQNQPASSELRRFVPSDPLDRGPIVRNHRPGAIPDRKAGNALNDWLARVVTWSFAGAFSCDLNIGEAQHLRAAR